MAQSSDETFLGRWSRRKQEAAREQQHEPSLPSQQAAGKQNTPADPSVASDDEVPAQSGHKLDMHGTGQLAELTKVDIATLDFGSDYTPFMHKGVPESLQSAALRKLWASDPVFSTLDGLDDCCADFSDAAWAEPGIKTAYRIGRGFLTDTEVEAWANLGKPQQVAATTEAVADSEAEVAAAAVASEGAETSQGHSSQPVDPIGGPTVNDAIKPATVAGEGTLEPEARGSDDLA